jgi:hypothetical protein
MMSVPLRHVRQQDPFGCGVACVAMLTGQTYADALAQMGPLHAAGAAHYQTNGGTHYDWFKALARLGYAVQFLFRHGHEVWPLPPWAPAHIVQVGNHVVVLLPSGDVFDPACPAGARRILSDYPVDRIFSMAGVFRVGAQPILGTIAG